jgi:hypothetical protein
MKVLSTNAIKTIASWVNSAINASASNGANSVFMPDELVEIAAWVSDVKSKPRPELLELAEQCGAHVTGKPNGTERITVSFSVSAWHEFDARLGSLVSNVDKRAFPNTQELADILREASSILAGEKEMRHPIIDELDGYAGMLLSGIPIKNKGSSEQIINGFDNLIMSAQARDDLYDVGYITSMRSAFVKMLESAEKIGELHDFVTHRASWRKAIEIAAKHDQRLDDERQDTSLYWAHELKAFDKAMYAFDLARDTEFESSFVELDKTIPPHRLLKSRADEFNRYFTSMNNVDVSQKVTVDRDEWRSLYASIRLAFIQKPNLSEDSPQGKCLNAQWCAKTDASGTFHDCCYPDCIDKTNKQ